MHLDSVLQTSRVVLGLRASRGLIDGNEAESQPHKSDTLLNVFGRYCEKELEVSLNILTLSREYSRHQGLWQANFCILLSAYHMSFAIFGNTTRADLVMQQA